MNPWEQLAVGIDLPFHPDLTVPVLHEVTLPLPSPPEITDVERVAHEQVVAVLAGEVRPGMTVAVGGGSRGLTDRVGLLRGTISGLRAMGADPFVVPAMGSHGGATAEGQRKVLESYGLGDASIDCEIRSSMDVVELPQGASPVPVVTDACAASASATIVVNRIKAHTDFHGPYESGLMKMIAIGLGKRVQAEALHAHGVRGLREMMPSVARQVLAHGNVVLGVGIVENALDRTMAVEAVAAAAIPEVEPRLLDLARANAPRLPLDLLDVLLIDRMGKDISGVGMDTNVIGRLMIGGQAEPERPRISMIACHELTPASHGNACGVGLADIVTARLADSIDHEVTRTNIVTSGFLLRGKLPVVAAHDAEAWAWCLRGAGIVDTSSVRAARIVDTLHCSDLWVTDTVLADLTDLTGDDRVEVLARDLALHDERGRLTPFDA